MPDYLPCGAHFWDGETCSETAGLVHECAQPERHDGACANAAAGRPCPARTAVPMTADTLIAAALKRLGKVEVAWRRGAFVVTITTEAGTRSWSDISWSSLWMRVVMAALEAKLEGRRGEARLLGRAPRERCRMIPLRLFCFRWWWRRTAARIERWVDDGPGL
jgi:hypothetical protein